MIQIELIAYTNLHPLLSASHAGKTCYTADMPDVTGKLIDVEKRLFKTSHHTTLEHFAATFAIEGISVGDITFGMHLAHPFYNSDQRSGRFCAKMFLEPNFEEIEQYIKTFWPKVAKNDLREIMDYVQMGVKFFHQNMPSATETAARWIREERPKASEAYISQNAPKIAQEQLRMFISVIFPTAFDFSCDLITLASMFRSDWNPVSRFVTEKMADLLVSAVKSDETLRRGFEGELPDLNFVFDKNGKGNGVWAPKAEEYFGGFITKPRVDLLSIIGEENFVLPEPSDKHPVDNLHFLPQYMDNSVSTFFTKIAISTATMGQDQRHRTIGRGIPRFTGEFYLPPIMNHLGFGKEATELMVRWYRVRQLVHPTLATVLAPYGAVVEYTKRGSFNAVAHEQAKRLCWCAQEEIYHAGRSLMVQVEKAVNSELKEMFQPNCYRTGQCAEGDRYCGRDISVRNNGDYFPERKV